MGWLKTLICGDADVRLAETSEQLRSCEKQLGETVAARNAVQERYEQEQLRAEALEKLVEATKAQNPTDIPEATIEYGRYFLDAAEQVKFTKIDIRLFITNRDKEIYKDIKTQNLFYSGREDLDLLIPKLYKAAKKGYKYAFDNANHGFSEVWLFPFELRAVKRGDCEDWSHNIGSYFAVAGIPRDQWFVSCGEARAGYGHSTVYARDNNGTWRHLNSTKPEYRHKDLKDYPSKDNQEDTPGIKPNVFWFSFNDQLSIQKFETPKARKTFNEELGDAIDIGR